MPSLGYQPKEAAMNEILHAILVGVVLVLGSMLTGSILYIVIRDLTNHIKSGK